MGRQIGEDEFFARTLEFEPLKGLRNPKSDRVGVGVGVHGEGEVVKQRGGRGEVVKQRGFVCGVG